MSDEKENCLSWQCHGLQLFLLLNRKCDASLHRVKIIVVLLEIPKVPWHKKEISRDLLRLRTEGYPL